MANFKGFKQVLLSTYNATSVEEKKDYLWLVRELDASGETLSSAIYFGNRKYADITKQAEDPRVGSLIASLGSFVDENGEWVGFLPLAEHEILGNSGITSAAEALEALEAAILENADAIEGKVSVAEYEAKVAEVEGRLDVLEASASGLSADVEALEGRVDDLEIAVAEKADASALQELSGSVEATEARVDAVESDVEALQGDVEVISDTLSAISAELETKADADDVYTKDEVYTKEEVDAKVAGAFEFKGEAEAISADETTITVDGVDIVASSENVGWVYQIVDKEYASNGEKWVLLGFNIDLSAYATKEFVRGEISAVTENIEAVADEVATVESALTAEIAARETLGEEVADLEEEVEDLDERATITANTYSDAAAIQNLRLGRIVYVLNEEIESGITYTSGAYIYTAAGLKKLDSTTPSTSTTLEERVEALENEVADIDNVLGDTAFSGDTLTAAVAQIQTEHVITGDDVEE